VCSGDQDQEAEEDEMSNQRRTEEEALITENFLGVNQLIDELDMPLEFAPDSRGSFPSGQKNMERLPGKKLNSSNTTGGHVLTLAALQFKDKSYVLIHQSSNFIIEDDIVTLMSPSPITPLSPTEPFIFS